MSESFEQRRREPLLQQVYYEQSVNFKEKSLADQEIDTMLADLSIDNARRKRTSWRRTFKTFELLIQRYSGGDPVGELTAYAARAFTQFQRHYAAFPEAKLKLWEPDSYQYVMWLLSLAVLLGLKEWVPVIATWISTDPEDGQDVLVSRLFGRMGVSLPGESLIHEKPYADLLRATETQGEAQQQAMADYLKRWYGGMKDCYWYDLHKERTDAGFFGYWAFEAGLVTLLWNIDDGSYRDMRFYPKDLVDFGREQMLAPQREVQKPHISRRTGERCPYAGRWGVLESPGAFIQERMFKEGDVFPDGIGRDRQEGPVTWIVMSREDGGPTREE
jgi:hypothetical protein